MARLGALSGQKLNDKYLLGDLLGTGGFGAVYQAHDPLLNRPQAIKILLEEHFHDPKFRERFLREAQTLAALDHPNIVHVDDLGIQGNLIYLVMPYLSGGTLQDVLTARGPLPLDEIDHYLAQICAALDYAHAKDVVHLDLKPLNLLLHQDGRVVLSDFGLAHLMKEGAVQGGTSLSFGTPTYMAPEHLRGQPDWRSDLYALGIILYQLLTGHPPFEGASPEAIILKHIMEPPPPLHTTRQDLPGELDSVLAKALAKEPEQRYQQASDLHGDFRAALRGRLSGPPADSYFAPTRVSQPALDSTIVAANPPKAFAHPQGADLAVPASAHAAPRKNPILWWSLGSLGGALISMTLILTFLLPYSETHPNDYQSNLAWETALIAMWIGIPCAIFAGLASWFKALGQSASRRTWGWFVIILVLFVLGAFLYGLAGQSHQPEKS